MSLAEEKEARDKAMELLAVMSPRQPRNMEELRKCLMVMETMLAALLVNVRPIEMQPELLAKLANRVMEKLDAVQSLVDGKPAGNA